MIKKLSLLLLSSLLLANCSDDGEYISKQEKEFVKACTSSPISKSECRCIYSDLMKNVYSEEEMENILNNAIPASQATLVKNKLRDDILRSYANCKK